MNFSRLKELVRKLGGVLVLDGDEPEFVMLSYDKYQKIDSGEEVVFSTDRKANGYAETNGPLRQGSPPRPDEAGSEASKPNSLASTDEDQESMERLNQEILALKEEIRQKEEAELVADEQSTEAVAETIDLD